MNFSSLFGKRSKAAAQVAVAEAEVRDTEETKGEARVRAYFEALGIKQSEIIPRVNVLTFDGWLTLGRIVKKGQHGCKLVTFKDHGNGKKKMLCYFVFHVTQTSPIEAAA